MKAIILAFALASVTAHAAQIEVGAGVAQSATNGDGTWYQQGLQHSLNLKTPAFMVGVTGNISPHFSWHLDAVDLGSYSVNSWDTYQDDFYNTQTHQCVSHCGELLHFLGSGHIYGVAATLEAHTTGAWQVGIEAGPFLYHSRWGVNVSNYKPVVGWAGSGTTQCGNQWGTTNGEDIARTCSGWKIGAVIGVRLSHGPWALSIRRYQDGGGFHMDAGNDGWAPLWNHQTVAMVTYTF